MLLIRYFLTKRKKLLAHSNTYASWEQDRKSIQGVP